MHHSDDFHFISIRGADISKAFRSKGIEASSYPGILLKHRCKAMRLAVSTMIHSSANLFAPLIVNFFKYATNRRREGTKNEKQNTQLKSICYFERIKYENYIWIMELEMERSLFVDSNELIYLYLVCLKFLPLQRFH